VYEFKQRSELIEFIAREVLTSAEAARLLGISRAALSSLVKRGKIHPIKETEGTRLFFKPDIEERLEQLKGLRSKFRPYDP
jgi:DNA-binding transcriptional MerR regulator